eukprot:m.144590 g.144590  ORF g.144590 m.144590 type:complete len:110 (+) comp38404_c0_seq7:2081-2410(+)
MFRAKTLIVLLACLTTLAAGKTSQITAKRLFIGGLFPIEKNDQWFLPYADVICQMAVVHVNANPSLLPGFELVLRVNDTKVRPSMHLIKRKSTVGLRDSATLARLCTRW